jgi:hypothetical protein
MSKTYTVKPFEIYIDARQHCLFPRWYCKFLFWMKHGEFKQKRVWVKYQSQIPCNGDYCNKHYACHLWETGYRVKLRKFLFIKWLELSHL